MEVENVRGGTREGRGVRGVNRENERKGTVKKKK